MILPYPIFKRFARNVFHRYRNRFCFAEKTFHWFAVGALSPKLEFARISRLAFARRIDVGGDRDIDTGIVVEMPIGLAGLVPLVGRSVDAVSDVFMGRLSDRLEALTGWRVVAVRGLVPDEVFFDHLANRRFPAGAFLRSEAELDYIEEPDVFHDIFGHVPLLADPVYAAYLQAYGQAGARAMARGRLKNLARLYWYTVEFGLIEEAGALRLFGAGIMSSTAESVFALEDPSPHRVRFDLERVMRTDYIIDDFQQVYFVIDSFEALLAACDSDFGPLYDRLEGAEVIAPNRLLPGDAVLTRGTLAYFDKG